MTEVLALVDFLILVGEEGIIVDLERGRARRMERERKRLRVCKCLVGEAGIGGMGMCDHVLVVSMMGVDGFLDIAGGAAEWGVQGSCTKTEV